MEHDLHLLEPGKNRIAPRATARAEGLVEKDPVAPTLYEQALTLPFSDQVSLLQGALSFNRSQVAEVMQVSRPTLYGWIAGAEPGPQKSRRMLTLLGLVSRAGLSAERPLLPRFVRHPLSEQGTSLLELLRQDAPPEGPCLRTLVQAREMTARWAGRAQQKARRLHAPATGSGAPVEKPAHPEFNYVLL